MAAAVFLATEIRKKLAAINDPVNLHTSSIGRDKRPEVAVSGGERDGG
jgi:hypothetical protein